MADQTFVYMVLSNDEFYHVGFDYKEAEKAFIKCTDECPDDRAVLLCVANSGCELADFHEYMIYNPSN